MMFNELFIQGLGIPEFKDIMKSIERKRGKLLLLTSSGFKFQQWPLHLLKLFQLWQCL